MGKQGGRKEEMKGEVEGGGGDGGGLKTPPQVLLEGQLEGHLC